MVDSLRVNFAEPLGQFAVSKLSIRLRIKIAYAEYAQHARSAYAYTQDALSAANDVKSVDSDAAKRAHCCSGYK